MNSGTEPLRSKDDLSNPVSSGTAFLAMKNAMSPRGTLMKKIQCHDPMLVSTAPSAGPKAVPTDPPSTTRDSATPMRSFGMNFTPSIVAEAASIAAPTPCIALLASSTPRLGEIPQRNDPRTNTRNAKVRTFFMPPLSEIFPNTRINPAIIRK